MCNLDNCMDLYDTGLPEAAHWCIWEALSSSDPGVAQKPVLYTFDLLEFNPYITAYIENIAMYMAITIKPATTAMPTSKAGSNFASAEAIAMSSSVS